MTGVTRLQWAPGEGFRLETTGNETPKPKLRQLAINAT